MAEPQPIDWLTRLIMIFASFTLGFLTLGQSSTSMSRDLDLNADSSGRQPSVDSPLGLSPNGSASLHIIETVEVVVMESFPMQVALNVTGYIPDGCTAPTEILQSRDGNMVMVRVFRTLPPEVMCAAIAAMYSDTIPLEGGFEPGHYTFDVNGVIVEVDL